MRVVAVASLWCTCYNSSHLIIGTEAYQGAGAGAARPPPNADAAEAGHMRLRLKRKATEEPDAPLPKSSVMGSLMYPPECSSTYPNERISRNACGGNEGLPFQPTPSHSPSSSHCRRNIKKPWQVSHSYSTILALTRHLLQQVVFLSSLPEKT